MKQALSLQPFDIDILMHREAHFGGKFSIMLEYYLHKGKGRRPEFSIARLKELQVLEQSHSLITLEQIDSASMKRAYLSKKTYLQFKALYEHATDPDHPSLKIADLILSEDIEPQREIQALLHLGDRSHALLLQLLNSDKFYDSVYPGYGHAPKLAASCLGSMSCKEAVKPLFEKLFKVDPCTYQCFVHTLCKLGKPAKEFLEQQLHAPIAQSRQQAANVLAQF